MRSPGFVYVMVNPRAPQFVRVGRTDGPPVDVAQESQLQLRDAAYFSDAISAEGFVHEYLETFQTQPDPEIFEVPVETALQALSVAMEKLVGTRANLPAKPSLYDDEPEQGNDTSAARLFELGAKYRSGGDALNAIKCFNRAARLSEPRAFLALAEMTEQGEGIRADASRAVEWLQEGTRAGVRECWGALADRDPQTKYLRPYFEGATLTALSPDGRQLAVQRMRIYLEAVSGNLETEDERVIQPAIAQLGDRELQHEWQRIQRKSPAGGVLRWILALGLVTGVVVLYPTVLNKLQPPPAPSAETSPPPAADEEPPASKTPAKARRKGAPASPQPPAPLPLPQPVVGDASKLPEAPAPAIPQARMSKAPQPSEATPKREITAEELREQFNWGKDKADAAFKDSVVKITETVVKVGKHDISFKKIKCKFNGEPPARVEPGMTVTVEGTVQGKGFWTGTIALENCRVLPNP